MSDSTYLQPEHSEGKRYTMVSAGFETPVPARGRLLELDGLRGVAIALVTAGHFFRSTTEPFGLIASLGWIGVDLFFVLSGFLITGVLLEARGEPGYYRHFYLRRALRILPLYYGFLAVVSLLHVDRLGAPFLAAHWLWFWTHTTNWLMATPTGYAGMLRAGFSAFWSLAIEEQFYLVWPVLVAVLSRRGLGWGCAILFAGAVGSRLWLVLLRAPVSTVYVVTPARLDPLLFGAVLAAATRSPGGLRDVPAGFAMFVGMVGLVAFVVLGGSPAPASTPGLAMAIFTLAVGWSGVLVATVRQTGGLWGALMRSAGLRWLGRYSYAMYLLQLPLDHALRSLGFTPQRAGFWTFGAVGTATVCLAAYLSWHVWEKRWLALTERFPRRAPQLLPVP